MMRTIGLLSFAFALVLVLGLSLALATSGDGKTTKSAEAKKEAKGCCMKGAKAEKVMNEEGKATDAKACDMKHADNKHGDGDLAGAADGCDSKGDGEDCCAKKGAEVKAEKKTETKPLR